VPVEEIAILAPSPSTVRGCDGVVMPIPTREFCPSTVTLVEPLLCMITSLLAPSALSVRFSADDFIVLI
jgi:hypothetical protein